MRIVRFQIGNCTGYGVVDGTDINQLKGTPFNGIYYSGQNFKLSDVKLLAPCCSSKVVAIGLNYKAHAAELKHDIPESPLMFLKPSTAVIGHGDDIIYPVISKQVDFEGELGVVIGKQAYLVSTADALKYVLGYTCFNDVTARDLQRKDGQWTRAKGFDTFAAVGPWVETNLDTSALKLETFLNGELKQSSNTANMIFSVAELVSAVSQVMTLLPGDIIASGTPNGIGPMQIGDEVEVKIDGIGSLQNRVRHH
ncbi:MAG: fumarylacetoacetate hydrolase family protein [Dehalococcoidia bacterium]|nr:fumarylacetoacetate hydrolase family protein [Dehalococcoidia bacterium]